MSRRRSEGGGAPAPGAEVSIYTRKSELVGKGMVHSVYDDDLYVDDIDSIDAPKDTVEAGFVGLMNYSAWDEAKYIRVMQGTLANAALETQEEANRMRREIADESRTNLANRERWHGAYP